MTFAATAIPCFLGDAIGSLGDDLDLDRLVCVPVATDVRSRREVALKMGLVR